MAFSSPYMHRTELDFAEFPEQVVGLFCACLLININLGEGAEFNLRLFSLSFGSEVTMEAVVIRERSLL